MIFAFNHKHAAGDICSAATCEFARAKPTLCGSEVHDDIPMRIVREASPEEYLSQPVPEGWGIPPLINGCLFIYEIQTD